MDRWARRWHLLTAAVAAAALLLQLGLVVSGSAVLMETDPPSLAARVGRYFYYFTIQSNALVALSCAALARDPAYDGRGWRVLRSAAVVGIAITGVVHFVLLRPLLDLDGLDLVADRLLHLVVPLLAVVGWAWLGPRPRTGPREVGLALVWPVAWLAFSFGIRALTGWVPYPFLDPDGDGGAVGVALACAGITALFLVVSLAVTVVDHRAPQRFSAPGSSAARR